MSKTRLDLNALSVESFETAEALAPSLPTVTVTHCIYCGVTDISCVTICVTVDTGSVA